MATSVTKTRTNYFAVTDKKAFEKLVDNLVTSGNDKARSMGNCSNEYGFYCDDTVRGIQPETDESEDFDDDVLESEMVKRIQELLVPKHACIITDITYENLKVINGTAMVITKDDMQIVDLRDESLKLARKMLHDPDYNPDMEY